MSLSEFKYLDYRDLNAINVEELNILNLEPVNISFRHFRGQNLVKKILFFMIREGLIRLTKKLFSQRYNKYLNSKICLVKATDKNGKKYIGMQFSKDQPVFYFLNAQFENLENYYKKFYYNPFIGYLPNEILIYPQSDSNKFKSINFINNNNDISISKNKTDLYIIGCGDYFRTYVYPHFKKSFNLAAAIDFNYEILRNKFLNKFKIKTNDFYEAISGDSDNNKLAIIASYHSYHTTQALEFMKLKNSKVIIEKPPCVNYDDFNHLLEKYDTSKIFIGYNRRHIPWVLKVKKLLKEYDSPCVMSIEIKEVQITKYHWYNAPNQGSRIAGNLCHWIDLTIFLLEGKKPVSISISKNKILGIDNSTFIILFDDGSIVTLIPSDYGDGTYGVQEFIKIRNEKLDIRIDDFMHMRLWINGKVRNYYKLRRDKGHDIMYKKFCNSILSNKKSEYTKNDLIYSTSIYLNFIKLYYSDESNMELHFS